METLRQDDRGFTLVELMVALLITLVGLVGLLQAVNVAMQANATNQLRDEATMVAERTMANLKSRGFTQISGVSGTPQFSPQTVTSQTRGGNVHYSVFRTCSSAGTGPTARLKVRVQWKYKGNPYSHTILSVRAD